MRNRFLPFAIALGFIPAQVLAQAGEEDPHQLCYHQCFAEYSQKGCSGTYDEFEKCDLTRENELASCDAGCDAIAFNLKSLDKFRLPDFKLEYNA